MKVARRGALDFGGVHLRIHPVRLALDTYQVDRNGSRYQARTWRPRQGVSRSNVAKLSGAIRLIDGFRGADGVLKIVTLQAAQVDGFSGPLPLWDEGLSGIGSSVYTVT